MKVIHDLKNPVMAIIQVLNENSDLSIESIRKQTNPELEDLGDMLDNLRMEFKSHNLMDVNEKERRLESLDFINGLMRTHSRLAKNLNCKLRICAGKNFPSRMYIQRLNVKRVVNNLISNAIKHTQQGKVDVDIKLNTFKRLNYAVD